MNNEEPDTTFNSCTNRTSLSICILTALPDIFPCPPLTGHMGHASLDLLNVSKSSYLRYLSLLAAKEKGLQMKA